MYIQYTLTIRHDVNLTGLEPTHQKEFPEWSFKIKRTHLPQTQSISQDMPHVWYKDNVAN